MDYKDLKKEINKIFTTCLVFRTVHFTCTYKPGVPHPAADSAGSEPSNPTSSVITYGIDFYFWVIF